MDDQNRGIEPRFDETKSETDMKKWKLDQMPDQTGRVAVVTGANTGWTGTDLQRHSSVMEFFNRFFAQTPPMGALPTLRAATDPQAEGGDYYGPRGFYEMRGYPKKVGTTPAARNELDARRLWQVSEELTGVSFLSRETAVV